MLMINFMQEPAERVLGRHYEEVNGKLENVSDCCYDIPLLESLQCLLMTDVVREQVCVPCAYNDDDGLLHSTDLSVLSLTLYTTSSLTQTTSCAFKGRLCVLNFDCVAYYCIGYELTWSTGRQARRLL